MSHVIAVIVGGLVGSAWSGGFGTLVGALLGWMLWRLARQDKLIAGLQAELSELRALLAATAAGAVQMPPVRVQAARQAMPRAEPDADPQAEPQVAPQTAPQTAAQDVPPGEPQGPRQAAAHVSAELHGVQSGSAGPAHTQPQPAAATPFTAIAPAPHRPPRADALAPLKAWLFGGNTIVKAGVAILFIGLAFLAKFASEHVQLPVELRLAGIAAVALALLVVGWRLRLRRAGYAQVLQGGAVAVLYLTLFAAFRFYGVLAVGPVFALMVVVAALAAALAVLQDARALAVIGALGGFATPLLLSTGSGNQVALFSYYLVLDAGIAAVAWHRNWRALNLIGFAGTFVVASAWGVLKYQPQHYASSQGFLIAFFLLFAAIMLMPARRAFAPAQAAAPSSAGADGRADHWVQGCLLFGLPTITFVLQHGLVRDTEYGSAISALVLAAFYIALASAMRSRPQLGVAFEASLAIGTVFLTLVIPFALDARSTAGAWALEGAGLVWLGWRQQRGLARLFGYALLLLCGAAMALGWDRHGAPASPLNAYFFNALMVAAAALAAAFFTQRACPPQATRSGFPGRHEGLAEPLLIAWGTLWLLAAAALQIDTFVAPRLQTAAGLASFSAIALLFALLAVRLRWPRVGLPTIAHAPLHMFGALLAAAMLASPFQDGGGWAWPLALLTHGVLLWWLAPQWPQLAREVVHAFGVLVLAVLGALQGRAITADWGDAASAWAWLGWLFVPAALLLWLLRPASARRWPVCAAPTAYQWIAALMLAIGLVAWTLLANVASDGSALPLPHLPLLNPLDVGIGVALLAVALWARSEGARAGLAATPGVAVVALGGAGFIWLNAILIRAFHHYGGLPFRFDAWVHSLAVQTGITLLWTAIALVLMWLSARRTLRAPWLVGAALLAAVVLKLLLVDQSGTGTVTRIVSFIGVGVLMLVIGYVAPLPGKAKTHAQA